MGEFGPPDTSEKAIRFGCGFVVGLMLGVGSIFGLLSEPIELAIGGSLVVAMVCGYLAMRRGEGFWESLSRWFWFWS